YSVPGSGLVEPAFGDHAGGHRIHIAGPDLALPDARTSLFAQPVLGLRRAQPLVHTGHRYLVAALQFGREALGSRFTVGGRAVAATADAPARLIIRDADDQVPRPPFADQLFKFRPVRYPVARGERRQ